MQDGSELPTDILTFSSNRGGSLSTLDLFLTFGTKAAPKADNYTVLIKASAGERVKP
jgi:hypothetical protein